MAGTVRRMSAWGQNPDPRKSSDLSAFPAGWERMRWQMREADGAADPRGEKVGLVDGRKACWRESVTRGVGSDVGREHVAKMSRGCYVSACGTTYAMRELCGDRRLAKPPYMIPM